MQHALGAELTRMRAATPLVHNITNYVSMEISANALLAVGAAPAMIHAEEEAAEFAAIAGALVINIGTLSPAWVAAMTASAVAANGAGVPWVLDPVAAGATGYRRRVCEGLLAFRPTLIRGNASEILALAGATASGRGVDAGDGVEAAEAAARSLAQETRGLVAVTGPVDFLTDGTEARRIANGAPILTQVTAMGCALSAVSGAFLAGAADRMDAATAALAAYALAGEQAAAVAAGPGSFAPAFLDALAALDAATLDAGARVSQA